MKYNIQKVLMGAVVSALITPAAFAQNNALEEIIVTATKRSSSIQDVPFSINAQTQRDIERAGATTLEELSRNVAGVAIQNLGPGQSQVSIRGVSAGQIVRDQPGVKEQVGIYVDESVISLSLFTPDLDFYDLNRVETLRGPQGTLFGSGSIGGTIRYITNQPNLEESSGGIEVNLNTIDGGETGGHVKGYINSPFADGKAAFRGVVYHTEYAGFIDAFGPAGGDDVNSGNRTGGRFAITYQANDRFTITPRLIIQNIETDGNNRAEVFNFLGAAQGIEFGENEQFLLQREAFEDDIIIADLVGTYSFDGFDVTSVTSFTDREILVSRDASALTHSVSEDLGFDPATNSLPSNLRDTTDLQQFTQEYRISSTTEGPFQWLVGLFYSDTDRDYAQSLPTPGFDAFADASDFVMGLGIVSADIANGFGVDSPFNSSIPFELEQISLFGEFSYDINERAQVTVGGRFYDFEETRDFVTGGLFTNLDNVTDVTESDGFTSRVLFSYDANDNVTYNAQISEGFRLGGVNDALNLPLCSAQDEATFGSFPNFDDEELINYEVGVKASYGKVQFNAAAYYADISDLQVTFDAGSCSSRVVFNVPDASVAGVEFELKAKPSDRWDISFAASLLDATFDSGVSDGAGGTLDLVQDGNRLPSVPEFSAAASFTYSVPSVLFNSEGSLYFSGSFQFVGDRFTQPGDEVPGSGSFNNTPALSFGALTGDEVLDIDLELPSYEIVNVNVGYETENWSAVFYINNLTDENALLSFDRERGGRARNAFRVNQPRTFGATFRHAF